MAGPTLEASEVLAEYERHLVSVRDLAPHTVRTYLGDVTGLLDHADRMGRSRVTDLDLRTLRSWLAQQQVTGDRGRHWLVERPRSASSPRGSPAPGASRRTSDPACVHPRHDKPFPPYCGRTKPRS
jgi:hypothetical protein